MGVTIGAALKKIAVALLTDRRTLKTIGVILLVIIVGILTPLTALVAILSGKIELDTELLQQNIIRGLSAEDQQLLSTLEETMLQIDGAMKEKNMPDRVREAQALYVMALYTHADQPGFVPRLVSCFWEGQSDAQLINEVNREFGSEIRTEDFSHIAVNLRSTFINYSEYIDPGTKNNLDLVQWAIEAESSGWGYVWGTYGHVLTQGYFASKFEQYPDEIGAYADYIKSNWIGKRTSDCIGLIKGYCWFDPLSQTIGYAVNGMPDLSANSAIDWCTERGPIDTMPEIPGLLLWQEGHVGIYIGDGLVIEAMGTVYGVRQTQLEGRGWARWGKIPCIQYVEQAEETTPTEGTLASSE